LKLDKYLPTERLQPYIRYYAVVEADKAAEYKVFPSPGLVIGFQYAGRLATVKDNVEIKLSAAGITGITDRYKVFRNTANTGTVLVYFTETGFTQFATHPAHELFNYSLSLNDIFDKYEVSNIEEKLSLATNDKDRIRTVDAFLCSQLQTIATDKLIVEAVKLIYQSRGAIRIQELNRMLCISPSPFEKRFRKVVGASPKKFASIIRFNTVLDELRAGKSLTDICYEHDFFDQAHFIKAFKQFTGDTPENYKRFYGA